jgi:hypothetical protein
MAQKTPYFNYDIDFAPRLQARASDRKNMRKTCGFPRCAEEARKKKRGSGVGKWGRDGRRKAILLLMIVLGFHRSRLR